MCLRLNTAVRQRFHVNVCRPVICVRCHVMLPVCSGCHCYVPRLLPTNIVMRLSFLDDAKCTFLAIIFQYKDFHFQCISQTWITRPEPCLCGHCHSARCKAWWKHISYKDALVWSLTWDRRNSWASRILINIAIGKTDVPSLEIHCLLDKSPI